MNNQRPPTPVERQRGYILNSECPVDYGSSEVSNATIARQETQREKLKKKLDVFEKLIIQRETLPLLNRLRSRHEDVELLESDVHNFKEMIEELQKDTVHIWTEVSDQQALDLIEDKFGPGCARICAERSRVKKEEGFDEVHDSGHRADELANAGAVYAMSPLMRDASKNPATSDTLFDKLWPFDGSWYKPGIDELGAPIDPDKGPLESRIKELRKAGQLIAAEIDKLQKEDK